MIAAMVSNHRAIVALSAENQAWLIEKLAVRLLVLDTEELYRLIAEAQTRDKNKESWA